MGLNWGISAPFWGGGAGSRLTQCPLGRGLPPYTMWHLDPSSHLATTDMGRKLGGGCAPLGRGSRVPIQHNVATAEAYLRAMFHLDPSNCLAAVHQRYGQTGKMTDNGPIA